MIYLDCNATTPLDPQVREVMLPFLEQEFGNASSIYSLGRKAAAAIENAREELAVLLSAQPSEMIFTSCGTESIATALHSAIKSDSQRRHLITSAVEHGASNAIFKDLEQHGYTVTYLPVDNDGKISLEQLEASITSDTLLVSFIWANNETGVLFPIEKIAAITHQKKILLHIDAIQAIGKIPIDLRSSGIHYLSLSGHKMYAPKGSAALYVHRHAFYTPLLRGHQENKRRGGTENVSSIVALGAASKIARQQLPTELARQKKLRDHFETTLRHRIEGVHLNGHQEERLANTSNLRFDGVEAESALILLDQEELYCSLGSACSSGSKTPSHVLTAMGLNRAQARSSLRFSLGRFTTESEIEQSLEIISRVISKLRSL